MWYYMQYTWLASLPLLSNKTQQLFWYYHFLFNSGFIEHDCLPQLKFISHNLNNIKLKNLSGLFKPRFDARYSSFTTRNVLNANHRASKSLELSTKTQKSVVFHSPKNTLHQTLHLFFIVNQNVDFQKYKPHAQFRLFWLQNLGHGEYLFKPSVFIRKWQNIHAFLYNSFYFNHLPMVFSSKFFKKETLALNWFFHPFSLHAWRFASFFFTFYITVYTRKLNFFYKQLKNRGTAFALIIDLEYHFKTLFYLRRNKWFTLALVPLNLNPWSVSMAIPIGTSSLFTQFFFYKFLILTRKKAVFDTNNVIKQLWFMYKQTS